jgi:hypothetical protein
MTVGCQNSFWSGIKMIALNPSAGLRSDSTTGTAPTKRRNVLEHRRVRYSMSVGQRLTTEGAVRVDRHLTGSLE